MWVETKTDKYIGRVVLAFCSMCSEDGATSYVPATLIICHADHAHVRAMPAHAVALRARREVVLLSEGCNPSKRGCPARNPRACRRVTYAIVETKKDKYIGTSRQILGPKYKYP